jgi:hypothetical protein
MFANVRAVDRCQSTLTSFQIERPVVGSTLGFFPKTLIGVAQIVDGLAGTIITGAVAGVTLGAVGKHHLSASVDEMLSGVGSLAMGTFNLFTGGIVLKNFDDVLVGTAVHH